MNMTAQQQNSLIEAAWREFECSSDVRQGRQKNAKAARKRQQIQEYGDRLFEAVNSDNPPKTQDEAIAVVIGMVGRVLAYVFPQYALAIQVAIWLWQRMQAGGQ